jgi:hypothetical protein
MLMTSHHQQFDSLAQREEQTHQPLLVGAWPFCS